ncbi:hypothetical protein LTR64_001993 [Lithohypha guttulata]|uniref:uncharacterized protein n=1 Tax=Lithohypha guttulata TaxID=1690604 RepID=UPI002DDDE87F|nr:hypothetical protein LTR51_007852 [Lithohypha guttulata]
MSEAWDGPRLIINSNNKAALVVIVTAVGISWTALTLVIRIVSKLHVKRTIGLEELLVVVASFSAFCSSSCLLVAVKHGFGQRTKEVSVDDNMVALKVKSRETGGRRLGKRD